MLEEEKQYELALGEHQHDAHVETYKQAWFNLLVSLRLESIHNSFKSSSRKPIDWSRPPRYK